MDYTGLISMLLSSAGGIAGNAAGQIDRDTAKKILQALQDEYGKIQSPALQDVAPATVGPSSLNTLSEDPAAAQNYAASDAALADISKNGGLDLGDQAALAKVQGGIDRNESAQRNLLANQFARRGQLGSGAQLAMAMQGQQQAAQQMSDQGMQVAGMASVVHCRPSSTAISRRSSGATRSTRVKPRKPAPPTPSPGRTRKLVERRGRTRTACVSRASRTR
jgi:hypothetical protein